MEVIDSTLALASQKTFLELLSSDSVKRSIRGSRGEKRTFQLFIGDHRYWNDNPESREEKIKACTEVAANLIKSTRNVEERMEVVFLHRLHAKFYSMWSETESEDYLKWVIVGSSNLTDAALAEKNVELDIYLEPKDPQLPAIQKILAAVISNVYSEGESWGTMHDKIDELTVKSR